LEGLSLKKKVSILSGRMGKSTLPPAWALNISRDDSKAKEREDIRQSEYQDEGHHQ
jgi:hypothetical protein